MKYGLLMLAMAIALINCTETLASKHEHKVHAKTETPPLQCVGFSPYVDKFSPDYGTPPPKELINQLLDRLIEQTPFRCIMTYGVLNGLDSIFASAEARKLKVIAILWLDKDSEVNTQSINKGIEVAKTYPKTITKISCGSEVRTRHGNRFDGEITRCIDSLRKAKVTQPITTIDIWWEWCNHSSPCQPNSFVNTVDWIGTNIFPWWENKYSSLYPCIPAEKAADFHIAKLEELHKTYPDKEIILTEFGWPNAPEGAKEKNQHTGQECGIASASNQKQVVQDTFKKLAERHWPGIVFEAFSENWKPSNEGDFGNYWGICRGAWPYGCTENITGQNTAKPTVTAPTEKPHKVKTSKKTLDKVQK